MRRINSNTLAMIAGAAVLVILALFFLSRQGTADQDKLTAGDNQTTASVDPEKRCASQATYDLIKRELFRRAAQVRGSDQAAFDKLAAYSAIRMERPVLESENEDRGQVSCSGSLSLDLPPGVAAVGGRRTLTSDIDYSLQRAADRSGDVLTLTNAEAIITPLATLARVGQPTRQPLNPAGPVLDGSGQTAPPAAGGGIVPPLPAPPPPPPAPVQQPAPVEQPAATSSASPSFNCRNARTRGEIAVCSDSGLASLDRQMASQFNQAMESASPGERTMLVRTRRRFLSFRDQCRSDACVEDAYRGRMREIRDIMSARL